MAVGGTVLGKVSEGAGNPSRVERDWLPRPVPRSRFGLSVQVPNSLSFEPGRPELQRSRGGKRVLYWRLGDGPSSAIGTPVEALAEILSLDFRSDRAILDFALRWGPFLSRRAYDEQWNFDELVGEPGSRAGLRGRTVERLAEEARRLHYDGIAVEALEQRVRSLREGLSLADSGVDWDALTDPARRRLVPDGSTAPVAPRYIGARVELRALHQVMTAADVDFAESPLTNALTYLQFAPRAGAGSLEYAGIGLMILTLQRRALKVCSHCSVVFEPKTRHPDTTYCSERCRRLARNARRRRSRQAG